MMTAVMNLGRIKGKNHLVVAAKHNKRTLYEDIDSCGKVDSRRSHLNYSLGGADDPASVVQLWEDLRAAAGITKPRRKDEVSAIEVVFSLPSEALGWPRLREYFTDCVNFAGRWFGGSENLLCADVHLDQEQPHLHVLMLPLVNGKMSGSAVLDAGGKHYRQHHDRFFREVACHFGMGRPSPPLSGDGRRAAWRLLDDYLAAIGDAAKKWSAFEPAILDEMRRNPVPYLAARGIDLPVHRRTRAKTFEQIALSRGKGPKTQAAEAAREFRSRRTAVDAKSANCRTLCSDRVPPRSKSLRVHARDGQDSATWSPSATADHPAWPLLAGSC